MSSATLETMEFKIAYLERANNDLSDVVYRQQREIEELRLTVAALTEKVNALTSSRQPYSTEQEIPPHY
jgi:uncharacterized coiled-coil protein SlyX